MNASWTALLLLLAGTALASPDFPEDIPTIDVSEYAAELVVLDDGDGNLMAFRRSEPREVVFFGDKDHLYQVQRTGSSQSGEERWGVSILDFHSPNRKAGLRFREGTYTMTCEELTRELTELPEAVASRIAARATFHEHRWRRNAVGAYRDEYGVYYFIDRATGDDKDLDHRIYIGWRGQILRAPLKLLASDSLGRVYSAGNGTRRLVITGDKARYIEGESVRELHALDLFIDGPFLYGPLGVYGEAPHGTPCDALLPKGEEE